VALSLHGELKSILTLCLPLFAPFETLSQTEQNPDVFSTVQYFRGAAKEMVDLYE